MHPFRSRRTRLPADPTDKEIPHALSQPDRGGAARDRLRRSSADTEIVLQPGETDAAKWVTFPQVHEMIEKKQICKVIANQFILQEPKLLQLQSKAE